jgi:ribosomal protein S27E
MKEISLSQSAEKAKLIFCTSCGKIIGQPVGDYDMILEAIDGRLIELLNRK